jgi:hypothetical protein
MTVKKQTITAVASIILFSLVVCWQLGLFDPQKGTCDFWEGFSKVKPDLDSVRYSDDGNLTVVFINRVGATIEPYVTGSRVYDYRRENNCTDIAFNQSNVGPEQPFILEAFHCKAIHPKADELIWVIAQYKMTIADLNSTHLEWGVLSDNGELVRRHYSC